MKRASEEEKQGEERRAEHCVALYLSVSGSTVFIHGLLLQTGHFGFIFYVFLFVCFEGRGKQMQASATCFKQYIKKDTGENNSFKLMRCHEIHQYFSERQETVLFGVLSKVTHIERDAF